MQERLSLSGLNRTETRPDLNMHDDYDREDAEVSRSN